MVNTYLEWFIRLFNLRYTEMHEYNNCHSFRHWIQYDVDTVGRRDVRAVPNGGDSHGASCHFAVDSCAVEVVVSRQRKAKMMMWRMLLL